jgi:hypothetical protein
MMAEVLGVYFMNGCGLWKAYQHLSSLQYYVAGLFNLRQLHNSA